MGPTCELRRLIEIVGNRVKAKSEVPLDGGALSPPESAINPT
jgi:hypothetical protein